VQLAQIQSDENPALADLLGEALAEVDRLDGRIRALLTIHQTHENRPRQIHLGRVLETVTRALELRCKSQGITLNWQMDAELSALEADPDLIEDALLELGQNALRASTAPGRISLEARMHPNALELRVRDTGAGIPQAIQERIFDPFFTTHSDGTGVGLPSIRRRIEQAGGTLELDSSSTRGSSFLVRLPIARN
jgi:signal transduction histidine kinase